MDKKEKAYATPVVDEDGYVTLQIGSKHYDALEVYAKAKGMTVDEVFTKAIRDYVNEELHLTDVKDVSFGDKEKFKPTDIFNGKINPADFIPHWNV